MAKLTIDIGARIKQLKEGISAAKSKLGTFAKDARNAFNTVSGGVGSMLTAAALMRGVSQLIDYMDQIGKSARALGMTAEGYQKLAFAARRANMPQDRLNMSFQRMARFLENSAQAGTREAKVLERLKLNYNDLIKMKPDEQFLALGQAIDSVVNPTERLYLATRIYGRGARDVLNMVRGYQIAANEVKASGGIISDEDIQNAEEFKDTIEKLKTSFKALSAKAITPAMMDLKKILDVWQEGMQDADKEFTGWRRLASKVGVTIVAPFTPLLDKNMNIPAPTNAEQALFRKKAEERQAGNMPKQLGEALRTMMNQPIADQFLAVGGYLTPRTAAMQNATNAPAEKLVENTEEMYKIMLQMHALWVEDASVEKIWQR